jgi:Fic family protein
MPVFFDLLTNKSGPAVRVDLVHFIFVYIHTYTDGNGSTGRFFMNLFIGGYPWTVILLAKRNDYRGALEAASIEGNIRPFASFLGGLFREPD